MSKKKILLVEDQPDLLEILAKALRSENFEVLEAQNGLDALAVFRVNSATIDIVATDVNMPKMTGIEFMKTLRTENSNVKILFLSGYMEEESMKDILIDKQTSFLEKPFSKKDFLSKLSDLLNK